MDSLHLRISQFRIWLCMKLSARWSSAADKVCLDTKNLHFMRFYFDRSLQEGRVERVCWELKWIMKPERVKHVWSSGTILRLDTTSQVGATSIKEKHVHMIIWFSYHVSNRCEQANSWYYSRFSSLRLRLSLPRVRHWLDSPLFTRNCWKLKLVKVMRSSPLSSHGADFHFVGVSFEQIAKTIDKDEIWVAAGFYGQVHQHSQYPSNMFM